MDEVANNEAIKNAEAEINTTIEEVSANQTKANTIPQEAQIAADPRLMIDFNFDGRVFAFEKHPSVLMDIAPLVKLAYDARQGCGISEAILTGIKVEIKTKDGQFYWPKPNGEKDE